MIHFFCVVKKMKPVYLLYGVVLRLVFCFLVAITLPQRLLWLKSILIIYSQVLFSPLQLLFPENSPYFPSQSVEKITDQMINLVFLRWLSRHQEIVTSNKRWMKDFLRLLWIFLVLRVIGVTLFVITQHQQWLVYFPNFVGDLIVLYCIATTVTLPTWFMTLFILLFITVKVYWEYRLHWNTG
jgi:hypothetical protein